MPLVFDLFLVLLFSISILITNIEQSIITGQRVSIPNDYMIICSMFLSVLPFRDMSRSGTKPTITQTIFSNVVLIFGITMLSLFRFSELNLVLLHQEKFQFMATTMYTLSVLNLVFLQPAKRLITINCTNRHFVYSWSCLHDNPFSSWHNFNYNDILSV
jgi:hypothetical protein